LLDFIFYGFNMEDPLLGGYTDEKKYLRQAISLAMDWDERNDAIYNNICLIYDGMIPPGLEGHPEDGRAPNSYRGPDLQRARELLAKAGYPDGKGLPVIDYYSSLEGPGKENAEITARQLAKIGIKLNPRLDVFSAFIESVNNRKAPFFSFAWGSDYPDGENNLALFYGPNESPGANHFNYQNAEFDKLYEQIRSMPPSPERTAIYERMRDMVIEDTPFVGSMARTRYYLGQPWLKNFHPTEDFMNWTKYLVIETP
jgi:ABC-type transport system substrate-binding protein